MKRNKGERGWRAYGSDIKAKKRLSERGKSNVRRVSEAAWEYAKKKLIEDQWSPQQISGVSKLKGFDGISHEFIYLRILEDRKVGGELYKHLRCKKIRRRRYASSRKCQPKILNRVGIENRPALVNARTRIGDWEGDTIIGAGCNSGAIVSSVERVSRFTILAKVTNKGPDGVTEAIIRKMGPFSGLAYTLTVDNGGEFSFHEKIAQVLDMKIYFATPYHSWERGTNENTNGLVRQYFEKKMRFDTITDEDVQRVADKLNNRPRKCLGYQTPSEVFNRACKKIGVALRV
jgi:IS30 family transposase